MTLVEQRDAFAAELAALDRADKKLLSRMHYSTVSDILEGASLPYTLVQDYRNMLGEHISGYRYRFTSRYPSNAMLYVQETDAGRQHKSMRGAIEALRRLLAGRMAEIERAIATQ